MIESHPDSYSEISLVGHERKKGREKKIEKTLGVSANSKQRVIVRYDEPNRAYSCTTPISWKKFIYVQRFLRLLI